MTCSLKKNPFVANHLLKKIDKVNKKEEKEIIVTWSRASTIITTMIGHTIAIHNGKEHLPTIAIERTTGIEPVHGGFTIHCLNPLGYILEKMT